MWRLKIADGSAGGGGHLLRTTNGHAGRQVWVFDPAAADDDPDEAAAVDAARREFARRRGWVKSSSDLLMRVQANAILSFNNRPASEAVPYFEQFSKSNPLKVDLPAVKLEEHAFVTEEAVLISLKRAISSYSILQAHDGHWPGEYAGTLFLLPSLIVTLYVTGTLDIVLSSVHQKEIRRYVYNHQNEDGGWGLHIEGPSTMFSSAMNYVALRLLGEGMDSENGAMLKARSWILDHGGATLTPSWGTFFLSVLGVYDWSGNNPLPPEIWMLPYCLPIHPGRMWCNCRLVYLPMSYLCGKRFVGTITSVVQELREELYNVPYQDVDWNMARNECAKFSKSNPLKVDLPAVKLEEHAFVTEEAVLISLKRAISSYSILQAHDGHWPGEYAGTLFLLPSLIVTLYVTGTLDIVLSSVHQKEIRRYVYNHQNEDGGWGLHIEGPSTMFSSAMNYVALRLLGEGMDSENGAMLKARSWILDHGGATLTPSWGTFFLSVWDRSTGIVHVLGVYDWSGNNPLPPEIWMLPYCLPIHPGRMWCNCRLVYLPMSYLCGKRFVGTITSVVQELREELYNVPYQDVDWNMARNECAKEIVWATLDKFVEPILMNCPGSKLREKALNIVMEHIHYEDETTRYICIGPLNKLLNTICCWVEDPKSEAFKLHIPRIYDFLWVAEDGMKMKSYNGSQLWDTVLSIQAILATGLVEEFSNTIKLAHGYIKCSQILDDCPGDQSHWYRHITKGGWTHSTADEGWPVSDCTAEALKVLLLLTKIPPELVGEALEASRFDDAVKFMLSVKNDNGGFAAYEPTRSYAWLEMLNPSESFGNIMIEYPCVECTSSVIQALALFRELYPGHWLREEIDNSITQAANFIESNQRSDGSWYGTWGICFTYGTWFGIKGLVAAGRTYSNSHAIRKACEFLLSKELHPYGGWGESYLSAQDKVYTNLEGNRPHAVNTSWAMLALMAAGQGVRDPAPVHRAAKVLIKFQSEDGEFPQQNIIGVTNGNLMLTYAQFRNIFPIWALGEYRRTVLAEERKLL